MSGRMIDLVVQKTLTSAARVFSLDIAVRSDSRRVVLYGPSGAGKSLTLRAIAGLMTPERGRIVLANRPGLGAVPSGAHD